MEQSRYAVPLRDLDAVHVAASQQVTVQAEATPVSPRWDGVVGDGTHGGGGAGVDGDGE